MRQQLIADIQEQTGRELVVYFTVHEKGAIELTDADNLSEILQDCKTKDIDLYIQTPGGAVDACEKLISILNQRCTSYRVIVPSYSKSAGTVIALSAAEVVMGVNSELGPIDPQVNNMPAEILAAHDPNPVIRAFCAQAVQRMKALASKVLALRMMAGKHQTDIDKLVDSLSTTQSYKSHGAVIDASEAKSLGINVNYLLPDNDLWERIWLLYCMYDFDCRRNNVGKIFEGIRNSIPKLNPP